MSQIVPTSSHAQNLTGQTVNYFGPVLKGAENLKPKNSKSRVSQNAVVYLPNTDT